MKILVVEDDIHLLRTIQTLLEEEGYQVDRATCGEEGCYLAEQGIYDLLVLDMMLPGMDGLEIVHRIRAKQLLTPVLFLTARDSVEDMVRGLDTGADDYMTKPFEVPALLARLRALLRRRGQGDSEGGLAYHRLFLHMRTKEASIGGLPVDLTQKEFELLEFLLRNREQILTREQICTRVWGLESDVGSNVVDVYVYYLRRKLKAFDYDHIIHTIRNVGYMVKENTPCLAKPASD
ncbi:DNA-binding response regulator, OmpR family, contains REC and winged-helix (wHTH) domain [Paenibacillus sp. UNCCL117]|uniref:response regulator transcription factor n=1 Tax=unclassified Paenibacillus TaxID=185978 RepID=UPI00088859F6|nr:MULTISPECIES: response regulator transcription factor [unclassified Paenibacillus]SDD55941.1 DNA-binding response regulator, OmpR family, contains REC and winged-helix (wHTH) domain [Paenibacillus sp. cl123]SFW51484.1 DNA-binding response regulator, OmpR family, contains REC and winged-helix (wHTH) domain [Paenibacillus sp. UNCCL117]